MNIGFGEIIVILIVVLLIFGAKRLPEIGRSMGKAFREFKEGVKNGGEDKEEKK